MTIAEARAAGVAETRLPGEARERRRVEILAHGTPGPEDATWEPLHAAKSRAGRSARAAARVGNGLCQSHETRSQRPDTIRDV